MKSFIITLFVVLYFNTNAHAYSVRSIEKPLNDNGELTGVISKIVNDGETLYFATSNGAAAYNLKNNQFFDLPSIQNVDLQTVNIGQKNEVVFGSSQGIYFSENGLNFKFLALEPCRDWSSWGIGLGYKLSISSQEQKIFINCYEESKRHREVDFNLKKIENVLHADDEFPDFIDKDNFYYNFKRGTEVSISRDQGKTWEDLFINGIKVEAFLQSKNKKYLVIEDDKSHNCFISSDYGKSFDSRDFNCSMSYSDKTETHIDNSTLTENGWFYQLTANIAAYDLNNFQKKPNSTHTLNYFDTPEKISTAGDQILIRMNGRLNLISNDHKISKITPSKKFNIWNVKLNDSNYLFRNYGGNVGILNSKNEIIDLITKKIHCSGYEESYKTNIKGAFKAGNQVIGYAIPWADKDEDRNTFFYIFDENLRCFKSLNSIHDIIDLTITSNTSIFLKGRAGRSYFWDNKTNNAEKSNIPVGRPMLTQNGDYYSFGNYDFEFFTTYYSPSIDDPKKVERIKYRSYASDDKSIAFVHKAKTGELLSVEVINNKFCVVRATANSAEILICDNDTEVPIAARQPFSTKAYYDEEKQILVGPVDFVGVVIADLKNKTMNFVTQKDGLFSKFPEFITPLGNGYLIEGPAGFDERHKALIVP